MKGQFCIAKVDCRHWIRYCEDCDLCILPEDDTDGKFEGEL